MGVRGGASETLLRSNLFSTIPFVQLSVISRVMCRVNEQEKEELNT